ncbi:MAG: anhydro-N-acetylmuramic acid kinase [Planctomycetales bacterium]|nr:anhydro-N-acetylmuramic acid kinase [Planctomycetales bacterium]
MRDGTPHVRWDFGGMPKFAQSSARYAIGVSYVQRDNLICSSLVRSLGRGKQIVCDPIMGRTVQVPPEVTRLLDRSDLQDAKVSDIAFWRTELADQCAELVKPLIASAKNDFNEPLVISVTGLDSRCDDAGQTRYVSLCDATWLAERTGITVVDEFASGDLAHGGNGQHITAMSDWIMYGDRSGIPGCRNRAVLRFGPVVSASIVPSRATHASPPELVSFDCCPGSELSGILRERFGLGFDFETKFAVEAKSNRPLVDRWTDCLSRLASRACSNDQFGECVTSIVTDIELYNHEHFASQAEWVMTLIEFFARSVASSLAAHTPKSMPICELVLTGHYHQNALWQNRLRHYLPGINIRSGEMPESTSPTDATAAAVMGFLRIDNALGNSSRQTGTRKPRSLGRIAPGRPANWNSVLTEMSAAMNESMTLKSAV